MIKLEVNEGYIDATIKGNPITVATELKAESEESEKKMAEAFRKIMEELF